jgi:3,4-dihydroxy 2-butanone 4-phosphate synthase/GTP cyclohydrolase II
MARRPELEEYAAQHGLKIGTIADLIRHRLATEQTIERLSEQMVDTDAGRFRLIVYRDVLAKELHHALVYGQPDPAQPTLVRVHTKNFWSDVIGIARPDFGTPLRRAMSQVAAAGCGVVVVIGDRPDNDAQLARLQGETPSSDGAQPWRTTGIGAQILADLGLKRLRDRGGRSPVKPLSPNMSQLNDLMHIFEAGQGARGRGNRSPHSPIMTWAGPPAP